jgi:hypothetical protein
MVQYKDGLKTTKSGIGKLMKMKTSQKKNDLSAVRFGFWDFFLVEGAKLFLFFLRIGETGPRIFGYRVSR